VQTGSSSVAQTVKQLAEKSAAWLAGSTDSLSVDSMECLKVAAKGAMTVARLAAWLVDLSVGYSGVCSEFRKVCLTAESSVVSKGHQRAVALVVKLDYHLADSLVAMMGHM
jgi:hypothetical protein